MIKLDLVSKSFFVDKFNKNLFYLLKEYFRKKEKFFAVNKISLEVSDGQIIGVVGKNGSGKSTLLKLISGILKPTEGKIFTHGEIVYLSGFYNNLNKNLSMRDNIYIIGILNDLSRKQISQKLEDISNFSEIGHFMDSPIYKFSTGMITRLALTTTLFTLPQKPDILILDEALGGGLDEYFREKALKKIDEYIDSAKVVIIASHNLKYLSGKCSKVIWLEGGEIREFGDSKEIISKYSESLK